LSPKIICYDIETSPNLVYSWGLFDQQIGISQIVEPQDILCFAATEIGSNKIKSHASWDSYDSMLKCLWEMMDEADYIVGYNQIGFDDKHVKGAFARAGMPPPSPYRSIDLLRVVKKNFRFPSNKLAYVCEALGLDLKADPGGFKTWKSILDPNSPDRDAAQRRMVRYCRQDCKVTAQLFERLLPWIDGLNVPLHASGDESLVCCARCGGERIQQRGWAYTTTTRYKRMVCTDCGGWMRSAKSELVANRELLRPV
jgi:DNA polymerase elongation subunit (family B)